MVAAAADASLPPPWRQPLAHVRARLRRWWHARLPHLDTVELRQRNIYILPTRAGLMLALTLLLLLIASINYQLNLGYLLTFLIAGCSLAAMHIGYGTLRGLSMHLAAPSPVHSGTPVMLDITLDNARRTERLGIGLSLYDAAHWVWTDVPAQGHSAVQLSMPTRHRGRQPLPLIEAETRFPIGVFRIWTLWQPAATVLIYPLPEADAPPLPAGEGDSGGALSARPSGTDEYDGVRPYRRGDPLKHIVWKKAAQNDSLVSRDHLQSRQCALWLDLALCGGLDLEHRLSRLCAWVLEAEAQQLDYGLRLPGLEIAPAHGRAHEQRCLQALALC